MRSKRSRKSLSNAKEVKINHARPYAPLYPRSHDASYHGNLCNLTHRFINIG